MSDDSGRIDLDAIEARAELVSSLDGVWFDDAPDGWVDASQTLAQTDVPALIAEVVGLRARVDDLRRANENLQDMIYDDRNEAPGSA